MVVDVIVVSHRSDRAARLDVVVRQLLVGQVLQDEMNGIFGRDAHALRQADEISGRS